MKVDLHVHSKFSDRAADWLSRRLEFPASSTEPTALYDSLRQAGMDAVTITDHNTIAGCLSIADRPGVFLSEELIAAFPEDGVKVHLLIWGLSESDHEDLQAVRGNLYEVQALLAERQLAHAVAHPLHNPDGQLTSLHLQKLILLFRNFETLNGTYPALAGRTAAHILAQLTPQLLEEFAQRTGLSPAIEEPWRKGLTGGSDDHGGVFAGRAWTEAAARNPADFLLALREGRVSPGGREGNPLVMAHGIYSTLFRVIRRKLDLHPRDPGYQLMERVFSRFMEGKNPTEFSLAEKLGLLAQGIATGKVFELAKVGQNSLWKELAGYFSQPAMQASVARVIAGVDDPERRAFLMADLISGQLGYRFFEQFIRQMTAGKILESIQMLVPLAPIVGVLTPYLQAFRLTPRRFLREVTRDCTGGLPEFLQNHKRAWFTDTLDDVNGVSTTIRKMAAAGQAAGHDIVVVTSRGSVDVPGIPLKNFPPIGEFELPEYELQSLSFPPVLQILDYIAREEFTELIISTPGPVGLSAVLAAKLLGLPSSSIYHTDFPQYVGILTDDAFMETLTWNYMHWFYSQQELVYVNSEDYRRSWIARGIPEERLRILPRGLDTRLFTPERRQEGFWQERGASADEALVLFVGRVSKEKNLDMLVAASRELERQKVPVRFLFVGDGPYAPEMKRLLPGAIFTGYLDGEALAAAYASADLFAFPSTTDTFGNVILEAQACGLPCIVSDLGGPRDLVCHNVDGLVTRALDVGELTAAIVRLARDSDLRRAFGQAARRKVESRDWSKAFAAFWQESL
jgi:glycosyltransferase involved in cell wall biosynthesis